MSHTPRAIPALALAAATLAVLSAAPVLAQTFTYSTLVGSSAASADGTGGGASFSGASSLLFDAGGNLYALDGVRVRKLTSAAVVTTLPQTLLGVNALGFARDSAGNVYFGEQIASDIKRVDPSGTVTTFVTSGVLRIVCDLTIDSAGVLYVADTSGVFKIEPDGTPTRFAGGGTFDAAAGPVDGPVGVASYDPPARIVVDGSGTAYVSTISHLIRKITPDGTTTTIAGAYRIAGSTDGVGTAARFSGPSALAVDAGGNLYIADLGNHTIRRMAADGTVTTVAGQVGTTGVTQNHDGAALSATFAGPYGLAVAASGDLFIGDGPAVRKLAAGTVSTFAGSLVLPFAPGPATVSDMTGPKGVAFGSTVVYVSDAGTHTVRAFDRATSKISVVGGAKGTPGSTDGVAAVTAGFGSPTDIAFDAAGNAYVSDNLTIRKVAPDGLTTTLAGKAGVSRVFDGTAALARFKTAASLVSDPAGTIYVADGCVIRKVTPAGAVTTLAGSAACGVADGTGAAAGFAGAKDLALDGSGNVYVADTSSVRKVTPAGIVTTVAGLPGAEPAAVDGAGSTARFFNAAGITLDASGNLYVADTRMLRKITSDGTVTTVAGSGTAGGITDGTGSAARFVGLSHIVVAANGTIYGIDSVGLRAITPGGVVTTPTTAFSFARGIGIDGAGTIYVALGTSSATTSPGVITAAPDGTLANYLKSVGIFVDGYAFARATFNAPAGLALASDGTLAVADMGNHTIRIIRNDVVTTLAGSAGASGSADGLGGAARFNTPQGVAIDGAGNVYVADTGNNAIRKVTSGGAVSTVVAGLNAPKGVAIDAGGTLFIADTGSHTIRTYANGVLATLAGSAGASGSADGSGGGASFSSPAGLTLGGDGTIYVTDTGNHTIRAVTPVGAVTTIGGSVGVPGRVDGASSTARFTGPEAIAIDPGGSLYIADTQSGRLRLGIAGTATVPTFTLQPVSRAASLHETVQFTCAASANPVPAYEWQRSFGSGSSLLFSALQEDASYSGTNTPTLTITDAGAALNAVQFRCRAFNSAGSTPSAAATLTMPVLTLTPTRLAFAGTGPAGGAYVTTTSPQTVTVRWTGSVPAPWTAVSDQAWVQLATASGSGSGQFTASVPTPPVAPAPTVATAFATISITSPSDPEIGTTSALYFYGASTSSAPFGVIDTPANNATGLQGSLAVTGWALDDVEMDHVELWRDAVAGETTPVYSGSGPGNGKIFIANATFVPGARPDVDALYGPRAPLGANAGWGYMLLTQGLWNQGNGTYTLYAFAFDKTGAYSTIGTKTISVDNAHATRPFGTIDTPTYGGTVSGMIQNFGWSLTPGSTCSIANPNVQVSIDSGALTPVVYGDARADIAGAFPTYTNAAAAGGHYTLDTTTLTNGMHTIGWFVTDNCARADGMGSRFFTVANSSSVATTVPAAVAARAPRDWTLVRGTKESDAPPAMADGTRVVRIDQSERIELQLPGDTPYTAQLTLPIGSSFDASEGKFYWQPAPGFLGAYDLAFNAGPRVEKVRVVVGPPIRMVIDTPHAGNVLAASGFVVAGWAVDLASLEGAGIDTLHVWAYPVGGGAPVFVDVARSGGARPDVAKLYGASFGEAGFTVTGTLAPGTYDLAVFAHSAATNSFASVNVVRAIVK